MNSSIGHFAAVGTDIRFGLEAVRNVGHNVVEAIIAAREQKGQFSSLKDFLAKVPALVCNKRTIESLIKAGAFDSLGQTRRGQLEVYELYVDALVEVKRQQEHGQDTLDIFSFGSVAAEVADHGAADAFDGLPPIPGGEWDKATLLAFEREMLGLYVSDHPLFGIEHVLARYADTSIASLTGEEAQPDGTPVTIAGLVTGLQLKRTRKGDLWAIATVEDLDGAIECLFFPTAYQTVAATLRPDSVVCVRGRVSSRDDGIAIFAQELTLPDVQEGPRGPVVVSMSVRQASGGQVERLRDILGQHPGVTEVQVRLTQPGRSTLLRLDDTYRVTPSPALYGDLKALLGSGCLA